MTYQSVWLPRTPAPRAAARLLAFAFLGASAAVLAPACVDNESSIFIRGCAAVAPPQCIAEADTDAFITHGTLDLLFQGNYGCALVIGNQVVERGNSDSLRTETSRVSFHTADVRLFTLGGEPIQYGDGSAVEFATPISGFVDPGNDSDPGYGIAGVLMIDEGSAQALGGAIAAGGVPTDVVASVIVHGRTLGGQELETGEWQFPITVCVGCQCTEPTDDVCTGSEDGPDDEFCSTDLPVDCRHGFGVEGANGSLDCSDRIQAFGAAP